MWQRVAEADGCGQRSTELPSAISSDALTVERTLILCPNNGADASANMKKVWVRIPKQNAVQSQSIRDTGIRKPG